MLGCFCSRDVHHLPWAVVAGLTALSTGSAWLLGGIVEWLPRCVDRAAADRARGLGSAVAACSRLCRRADPDPRAYRLVRRFFLGPCRDNRSPNSAAGRVHWGAGACVARPRSYGPWRGGCRDIVGSAALRPGCGRLLCPCGRPGPAPAPVRAARFADRIEPNVPNDAGSPSRGSATPCTGAAGGNADSLRWSGSHDDVLIPPRSPRSTSNVNLRRSRLPSTHRLPLGAGYWLPRERVGGLPVQARGAFSRRRLLLGDGATSRPRPAGAADGSDLRLDISNPIQFLLAYPDAGHGLSAHPTSSGILGFKTPPGKLCCRLTTTHTRDYLEHPPGMVAESRTTPTFRTPTSFTADPGAGRRWRGGGFRFLCEYLTNSSHQKGDVWPRAASRFEPHPIERTSCSKHRRRPLSCASPAWSADTVGGLIPFSGIALIVVVIRHPWPEYKAFGPLSAPAGSSPARPAGRLASGPCAAFSLPE